MALNWPNLSRFTDTLYSAAMARRKVDTVIVKVALAAESAALLESLTQLGFYGKSPAEILRKFAENELERLVVKERILEVADRAVAAIKKHRRPAGS